MRFTSLAIVLGALLLLVLPTYAVEIATPTTGPVVIDGKLSEWDGSVKDGPITFDEEMADQYNATSRVMYDKDYLYVAVEVVEPHPPYNTYPNRGIGSWNADQVVIRMSGNPALSIPIKMSPEEASASKDLFTIGLWWNHLQKKTFWAAYYGIPDNIALSPAELAKISAVIKPAANDKGYTLEARLPWQLLNPTNPTYHPKAGDKLPFIWGVSFSSDTPAEPRNIFGVDGNGPNPDSFRSPGGWTGELIFK